MTAVMRTIEKFARNQRANFNLHPNYAFGTLEAGRHLIAIGDTGTAVELKAAVVPDFGSSSLEDLPSEFSSFLLRRNQDTYPAHWEIEYSSKSKEYFYCCRAVIPYSELSEQLFVGIVNVLYRECNSYLDVLDKYA